MYKIIEDITLEEINKRGIKVISVIKTMVNVPGGYSTLPLKDSQYELTILAEVN